MKILTNNKIETLNEKIYESMLQKSLQFYNLQKWYSKFSFDGRKLTKIEENFWHQFLFDS